MRIKRWRPNRSSTLPSEGMIEFNIWSILPFTENIASIFTKFQKSFESSENYRHKMLNECSNTNEIVQSIDIELEIIAATPHLASWYCCRLVVVHIRTYCA